MRSKLAGYTAKALPLAETGIVFGMISCVCFHKFSQNSEGSAAFAVTSSVEGFTTFVTLI